MLSEELRLILSLSVCLSVSLSLSLSLSLTHTHTHTHTHTDSDVFPPLRITLLHSVFWYFQQPGLCQTLLPVGCCTETIGIHFLFQIRSYIIIVNRLFQMTQKFSFPSPTCPLGGSGARTLLKMVSPRDTENGARSLRRPVSIFMPNGSVIFHCIAFSKQVITSK